MKKSNSISVFNQQGFTLIEILIAITLLGLISIAVVQITQNAAQTMERTTEVNKSNLQIETAMSRFEWDFSQIYSPLYFSTVLNPSQFMMAGTQQIDNDQDGLDDVTKRPMGDISASQISPELQQYFQNLTQRFERNEHFQSVSKEGLPIPRFYAPEKNVFEFFASSNRRKRENVKQSHFAWVRYALADAGPQDQDDENPNIPKGLKNLVRYFAVDDPYSDKRINPDEAQVKGAVLLEHVESLEFQFWDYQRKKWENSLSSIQQGDSVIRGVKIIITWYDTMGIKRSMERIFRNHWPMVAPQDPDPAAAARTQAQGGQAAGGGDGDGDGNEN
jgi:prepilin-type N-terminal cleavage/methylation domain-containing protein